MVEKGSTKECALYGKEFLQKLWGDQSRGLSQLPADALRDPSQVGRVLSQGPYKMAGYYSGEDAVGLLNPKNLQSGDVLVVQYRVPAENLGTQALGTKGLPDGGRMILSLGSEGRGHFEVYFQGTSASDHAQRTSAALQGIGKYITDIDTGQVLPVIRNVTVYRPRP